MSFVSFTLFFSVLKTRIYVTQFLVIIIQLMKHTSCHCKIFQTKKIIMHKIADFFKSTSDLHKIILRLMLCTFVGQ